MRQDGIGGTWKHGRVRDGVSAHRRHGLTYTNLLGRDIIATMRIYGVFQHIINIICSEDSYIERHGDKYHSQVEVEEKVILGQTIGNKARANQVNKVKVQTRVHHANDGLFEAVPDVVNGNEGLVDLQRGWHPDAGDGDVDEAGKEEDTPLETEDCF